MSEIYPTLATHNVARFNELRNSYQVGDFSGFIVQPVSVVVANFGPRLKILAEPCANRDGDALGAGAGRPEGPRRRHKRVARMHAARPHDEKLQVSKN